MNPVHAKSDVSLPVLDHKCQSHPSGAYEHLVQVVQANSQRRSGVVMQALSPLLLRELANECVQFDADQPPSAHGPALAVLKRVLCASDGMTLLVPPGIRTSLAAIEALLGKAAGQEAGQPERDAMKKCLAALKQAIAKENPERSAVAAPFLEVLAGGTGIQLSAPAVAIMSLLCIEGLNGQRAGDCVLTDGVIKALDDLWTAAMSGDPKSLARARLSALPAIKIASALDCDQFVSMDLPVTPRMVLDCLAPGQGVRGCEAALALLADTCAQGFRVLAQGLVRSDGAEEFASPDQVRKISAQAKSIGDMAGHTHSAMQRRIEQNLPKIYAAAARLAPDAAQEVIKAFACDFEQFGLRE